MPNPNYVVSGFQKNTNTKSKYKQTFGILITLQVSPVGFEKAKSHYIVPEQQLPGADNLTLLSFIRPVAAKQGLIIAGRLFPQHFSPLPSLPVAQPTLAPATNNITWQIQFFHPVAKWAMSASLPVQYFISQYSLSSALLHHGFKSLRNPPSRWNSVLWPKYRMELAHLKVRASR